ncbi:hypothetical protein CLAFUW4_09790 [Fulvia fulva]|uniref:F-box domain-containing protein n=1 Tax=Passalora fulva TaxID=5499 RepID=A0A9Q8PHZ7_PASFU|nr:uncharacterized protein CLAFUR5_12447 [Fulvia fulva]KAK4616922.1 hypothetical protein CLAFUR0_09789 [Fulvia fulva]UJO22866.1 hypothetical protein CLAFUR5_12447 [Fulvia fulva]WPV19079.1 hypothetical protein CLAFUW4_09790 [Fulvia fulva]WPV34396.1 hypothetical protein CLAFUW7_09793 [Fulvia fulva]
MTSPSEASALDATAVEESTVSSAVARVFGIHELAEMILEKLPTKDVLKTQRACRAFRDMIVGSSRIRAGCVVFDNLCQPVHPFDNLLNFKTAPGTSMITHYSDYDRCWESRRYGRDGSLYLYYKVDSSEPTLAVGRGMARLQKYRAKTCGIVTLRPSKDSQDLGYAGGVLHSGFEDSWRRIQWSRYTPGVHLSVHSTCDRNHSVQEKKTFPTLGEIYDWMSSGRDFAKKRSCPGDGSGGLHSVEY